MEKSSLDTTGDRHHVPSCLQDVTPSYDLERGKPDKTKPAVVFIGLSFSEPTRGRTQFIVVQNSVTEVEVASRVGGCQI